MEFSINCIMDLLITNKYRIKNGFKLTNSRQFDFGFSKVFDVNNSISLWLSFRATILQIVYFIAETRYYWIEIIKVQGYQQLFSNGRHADRYVHYSHILETVAKFRQNKIIASKRRILKIAWSKISSGSGNDHDFK